MYQCIHGIRKSLISLGRLKSFARIICVSFFSEFSGYEGKVSIAYLRYVMLEMGFTRMKRFINRKTQSEDLAIFKVEFLSRYYILPLGLLKLRIP